MTTLITNMTAGDPRTATAPPAPPGKRKAFLTHHNRVRKENNLPDAARLTNNPDVIHDHLNEHCGIDPTLASERLHELKKGGGLGASDDVIFAYNGDVFDARSGDFMGSLTQGGAQGRRR